MYAVRPYLPPDREPVRRIAFETGFMGESAEWYWQDAVSFADIWTAYYTDREPDSSLVAVENSEVIGYLLGCLDSTQAPSPRSAMTRQILRRQLFFRPGTARFLWRAVGDTLRHPHVPSGELRDARWPAHLHIDLTGAARGRGVGRSLMEAWLSHLRERASPGCHLVTLAENERAIGFFQRMGFERHGPPTLVPGMRLRSGARMHQQIMTKSLG